MGHIARFRLIRDRFVAGHDSCALRRHLDSVAPETPIWDIVDRCRAWESHADTKAFYTVGEPGDGLYDRMVAVVTIPPAGRDQFETLLRQLLPNKVVPALPPKLTSTELLSLLQHLLEEVQAPKPVPPPKTRITYMEALLQSLLPVSQTRPGPIRRNWETVVCFSCGKAGHGVND